MPPTKQANLAPPKPENLNLMRAIVDDIAPVEVSAQGAILWREKEGFMLHIPEPPEGETLPMPLYILGLCFVRLTTDPNFKQVMLDWANRSKN